MTKRQHNCLLMAVFSAFTGVIIGALTWGYLKLSNVGITLIWDKIGDHFHTAVYTLIVCLIGGVIIGFYQNRFGPCPENMGTAVRKAINDRSYPYKNLPIVMIAALLSLMFGGAVGPEAGLVCLLLSLAFWAKDEFAMARENIMIYHRDYPDIKEGLVLRMIIGRLIKNPFKISFEKGSVIWDRKLRVTCGVACGLGGLMLYIVFCLLFGTVFNLPHYFSGGQVHARDRLTMILLIVVGIAAGYLYLIMHKLIARVFEKLRGRGLQVLNAVLGGLILGIIGGRLPSTMFSGGTDIQTIVNDGERLSSALSNGLNFQSFQLQAFVSVPVLLVVIGVIKLFLTNVCIESGWRGGHFFPLLFSGVSIGYGFAEIFGTSDILGIVVVTGALLGTILQQPIGALALSVIFFPIQQLGWMILASFVAGCIPLPETIRINPDNKGFVYNVIHRKERNLFS